MLISSGSSSEVETGTLVRVVEDFRHEEAIGSLRWVSALLHDRSCDVCQLAIDGMVYLGFRIQIIARLPLICGQVVRVGDLPQMYLVRPLRHRYMAILLEPLSPKVYTRMKV